LERHGSVGIALEYRRRREATEREALVSSSIAAR
jgi:hypothetical protein